MYASGLIRTSDSLISSSSDLRIIVILKKIITTSKSIRTYNDLNKIIKNFVLYIFATFNKCIFIRSPFYKILSKSITILICIKNLSKLSQPSIFIKSSNKNRTFTGTICFVWTWHVYTTENTVEVFSVINKSADANCVYKLKYLKNVVCRPLRN